MMLPPVVVQQIIVEITTTTTTIPTLSSYTTFTHIYIYIHIYQSSQVSVFTVLNCILEKKKQQFIAVNPLP